MAQIGVTTITVVGNLTDDPELRFTPGGEAVVNFSIAVNEKVKDPQSGKYVDGDASFFPCVAWRSMAENIAESLTRGMRVIVTGGLKERSWETREGEKRKRFELNVDDIGPSLLWATAQVTRTQRNSSSYSQGNSSNGWGPGPIQQPANDPWATGASTADPPFN